MYYGMDLAHLVGLKVWDCGPLRQRLRKHATGLPRSEELQILVDKLGKLGGVLLSLESVFSSRSLIEPNKPVKSLLQFLHELIFSITVVRVSLLGTGVWVLKHKVVDSHRLRRTVVIQQAAQTQCDMEGVPPAGDENEMLDVPNDHIRLGQQRKVVRLLFLLMLLRFIVNQKLKPLSSAPSYFGWFLWIVA